jgi:hypothetical protein
VTAATRSCRGEDEVPPRARLFSSAGIPSGRGFPGPASSARHVRLRGRGLRCHLRGNDNPRCKTAALFPTPANGLHLHGSVPEALIGKAMDNSRLIDINELSTRISIPKGTLYNLVYLRRIPFVKRGRSLRFDPDEVIRSLPHYGMIGSAGQRWKGH